MEVHHRVCPHQNGVSQSYHIFLVDLGQCARDLTKCVVCKKLKPGLNKSEVDRF